MTTTPATASSPATRYLAPEALARLKNLHLAARLVVEGLFSGQHRSPRKGFSVEFAEHRQYTPGVDPRHIDWKVLARRDKLYIKQYEEQVNLRCTIVVDASDSMGYRHDGPMSKLEYAKYLAATLAYLMQTQHDAFGLMVCGRQVTRHIPPRQGRGHLRAVLEALEGLEPAGETDLPAVFDQLARTARRRGLIVVLSDLLGGASAGAGPLLEAMGHLRHRKHELIALQPLDRAELTFPFANAGQIEDIETRQTITADAEAIRDHYLERIGAYLDELRTGCARREIGYAMAETTQPFDLFLGTYLTRRMHGKL